MTKTKGSAEQALSTALRDRSRLNAGNEITSDTRVAVVAEKRYRELEDKSPSTMRAYRDRLDRQIIPALGAVRIGKLTVGLVDRHLSAVKSRNGSGVAKMTKSVLSGVCGLATRHDALESNPCRDVAAISTKPKKEPTSLSAEQIEKIHASSGSGRQANIDNLCSVAEPKPVIDPESPTVKQLRHPAPTRTRTCHLNVTQQPARCRHSAHTSTTGTNCSAGSVQEDPPCRIGRTL